MTHFSTNKTCDLKYTKICDCDLEENCDCNENKAKYEWTWDKESGSRNVISMLKNNSEVEFHGAFSLGTAAVRGNKLLEKGFHHFWEIKMLTPVYGTDIMIGIGTNKVDLNSKVHEYCSFLGLDEESIGFSFHGYIQYAGRRYKYGRYFGQGSLIGVHLDMWRGTLEIFINRESMGIAMVGLKDVALYPMVSSTVSTHKIRLTYSCSVPATLEIECLSVLSESQKSYLSNTYPALQYLTKGIFANILKQFKSFSVQNDNGNDKVERLRCGLVIVNKGPITYKSVF